MVSRGDFAAGVRLLRDGLDKVAEAQIGLRYSSMLAGLAHALAHAGEIRQGLATIDDALALAERTEERWCVPEMLRIKGELVRSDGNGAAAEDFFLQAV